MKSRSRLLVHSACSKSMLRIIYLQGLILTSIKFIAAEKCNINTDL